MVNRMYTLQVARLDRMHKFITGDERFRNLDISLRIDIILSFFIHCYHLKDWLRESGVSEKKVEDYIKKTHELKVCRDLTNSTKHLLSRNQIEKRTLSSELYDWKSAGVSSPISVYYDYFAKNEEEREILVISIDGKEHLCSDFMQQCIEKWNEFLDNESLDKEIT